MRRAAPCELHAARLSSLREMGAGEGQKEQWEAFARAYLPKLPDRVASEAAAANRVEGIANHIAKAPSKSAAEEPTT